MFKKL